MANKRFPGIPAIDGAVPREVASVLRPIREILQAFTDPSNPAVQMQSLADIGLVTIGAGGSITPATTVDSIAPPAPSGLTAGGALANIILTWDKTASTVVAYAEIWMAESNDFSQAQKIGTAVGQLYTDAVGAAATRYYWIRYISYANVPGPFNAQLGVEGSTGSNPDYLLAVLNGQITESQLYATLNSRIDLVDGPDTLDGSVTQRINTSSAATLANAQASVTQESEVRASETGYLSAYYGLRVQTTEAGRTVVGGIGIMGVSDATAGAEIEVGVIANRFWIGAPAGSTGLTDIAPFVVQTTDEVVNGVTISKGVYMDAAYIKNLTAMVARLGDAWIDDAMIANLSATKITAGDIDAARMSANIVTAASGRFSSLSALSSNMGVVTIDSTGFLNTSGASAYGTGIGIWMGYSGGAFKFRVGDPAGNIIKWDGASLTINGGGTFSGALSAATGTFAGSLSAATGTFAGSLSAATGTFAGSLSAATGSFGGSLSAATGTFAGTLTASAVNAVDTINLAGNAVTIPLSSFSSALSNGAELSLSINSSGAPITFFLWGMLGNSSAKMTLSLKKEGVSIFLTPQAFSSASIIYVETPGAGVHNYSLRFTSTDGTAGTCSFVMMETKR